MWGSNACYSCSAAREDIEVSLAEECVYFALVGTRR